MYDFASLLFSGPCNARCPLCIGRQLDPRLSVANLDLYPPCSLDAWIEQIRRQGIRQVTVSGTNTDPLLYRHAPRLLGHLRAQLPGVAVALHTNGRLALQKMDEFNLYDRACISFPSFDARVYRQMMGVAGVPDLALLLRQASLPVKLSILVTEENAAEVEMTLKTAAALGVRRLVLRKPDGELRPWGRLLPMRFPPNSFRGWHQHNPVFALEGMEVTLWDFRRSTSRCLTLFSSGLLSTTYRLTETAITLPPAPGPLPSPARLLPARRRDNASPSPRVPRPPKAPTPSTPPPARPGRG